MPMNYENEMKNVGHYFRLEAMHIKRNDQTPEFVELYPYLESYSENYESKWNSEDVYGRMDGINNFEGVRRNISLSIRVMAADEFQAKENLVKISKMIRFLYPGISKKDGINNIRTAPVLRLKFGNLINDVVTKTGLYGFINGGFTINPSHKDGYFTPLRSVNVETAVKKAPFLPNINNPALSFPFSLFAGETVNSVKSERANPVRDQQNFPGTDDYILWKYVDIAFTFSVLHNHALGNDVDDLAAGGSFMRYFPYLINGEDVGEVVPFIDVGPPPDQRYTDEPVTTNQSLENQQVLYDERKSDAQKRAASRNSDLSSIIRKNFSKNILKERKDF